MWSSVLDGGADTIVALATPEGRGALAVVRCSGRDAFRCAAQICRGFEPRRGWRVQRVVVVDDTGAVIDEVLLTAFPGPRTATGEDVVELSCHGSPYLARSIVAALVAAGARPAGPGEFTRRAMVNGKLDLLQAEGLRDLIAAETGAQARAARCQLEGVLSKRLRDLRDGLVAVLLRLEGSVDLVDHGVELDEGELRGRLDACRSDVDRLLATAAAGDRLRNGARVVLIGPTNAGKSTLFNQLLGWERTIVSPKPGTTRDAVEARVEIEGLVVTLVDTAGERTGGDEIETAGMQHARREAAGADLVLRLWPADAGAEPPSATAGDDREIRVLSKSDLLPAGEVVAVGWVPVSAATGCGIELVREIIVDHLRAGAGDGGDHVAIAARHRNGLERARRALNEVRTDLPEVAAESLREALLAIREMTGEVTTEDVLDAVFSTFCVGK